MSYWVWVHRSNNTVCSGFSDKVAMRRQYDQPNEAPDTCHPSRGDWRLVTLMEVEIPPEPVPTPAPTKMLVIG